MTGEMTGGVTGIGREGREETDKRERSKDDEFEQEGMDEKG